MIESPAHPAYQNGYIDTRGQTAEPLPFSTVIIQGLATGGGLFVPQTIPQLTMAEILELAKHPYASQAAFIYHCFGVDYPDAAIEALMQASYGENFTAPEIAPLVEVAPQTFLLELMHGPTSAFKDMALQCLPHFFSAALQSSQDNAIPLHLILVATSGDTGPAAQQGFKDRPHTAVIVFYPKDGVSDIQKRQMTTLAGQNVGAVGVEGNFDDCQKAVKAIFDDPAFAATLSERGVRLSSANSINWGRLLPQVVYFVSAYARLVAAGSLLPGDKIDVCVPTGNFGHILAAWYARQLGVPIGRLYCASNDNHVLTDFLKTGVYDISDRPFKLTPSPSMDILVSSNLERLLFELNGRDPLLIRQWMADLASKGRFQVDSQTFAALQQVFYADWVSSEDSLSTIRDVFAETGYLLEPHTAVAWKVAERLRPSTEQAVLITVTAHWVKFVEDVYRALNGLSPEQALPEEIASLTGSQLATLMQTEYKTGLLPNYLADLDKQLIRHKAVSTKTDQAIRQAIIDWLDEHGY